MWYKTYSALDEFEVVARAGFSAALLSVGIKVVNGLSQDVGSTSLLQDLVPLRSLSPEVTQRVQN